MPLSGGGGGGPLDFAELLVSLTRGTVDQQARLDEEYGARREEFLRLLAAERGGVGEQLLLQLAPQRVAIREVEVQARFRFAAARERRASLAVELLDLGFSRRYARSGYVENSVSVSVRRLEAPGAGGGRARPTEVIPPKGKANG